MVAIMIHQVLEISNTVQMLSVHKDILTFLNNSNLLGAPDY